MKLRDKEKEVRHLEKALGKEESKTLWVKGRMKAYQKSSTTDSSAHTFSMWPSKERERERVCVSHVSALPLHLCSVQDSGRCFISSLSAFPVGKGPCTRMRGKTPNFHLSCNFNSIHCEFGAVSFKNFATKQTKKKRFFTLECGFIFDLTWH